MNIKELIARLEAAQRGSVALDFEIAVALGWEQDQTDLQGAVKWVEPGSGHTQYLPRWTTMLDYALRLVPEGYGVSLGIRTTRYEHSFAAVMPRGPDSQGQADPRTGHGTALEPALALCIAALRARQQT